VFNATPVAYDIIKMTEKKKKLSKKNLMILAPTKCRGFLLSLGNEIILWVVRKYY
jgi:hypothetical protein